MLSLIRQGRKVQCQVLGNIEKYRYVFEQVTDAESSICSRLLQAFW